MKRFFLFLLLSYICINSIYAFDIGKKEYRMVTSNGVKEKRFVQSFSIEEYNKDGKLIYSKDSFYEDRYEYNEKGILIHYRCKSKNAGNKDWYYDYDDNNRCIHAYTSDKLSNSWYEYDEHGNNILWNRDNVEFWIYAYDELDRQTYFCHKDIWADNSISVHEEFDEYTDDGKIIMIKSNGKETLFEKLDKDDKVIYQRLENGIEKIYEYDKSKLIRCVYSNGDEDSFEYDKQERCISERYHDGKEISYEYSENEKKVESKKADGRVQSVTIYNLEDQIIYSKDEYGGETWYSYNDKGHEIYCKSSIGGEEWESWYEYRYYPNGIISRIIRYQSVN